MNGITSFKSKSDPTILFQTPIQIEDDLNALEDSAKTESLLMIKKNNPKHHAVIDHPQV